MISRRSCSFFVTVALQAQSPSSRKLGVVSAFPIARAQGGLLTLSARPLSFVGSTNQSSITSSSNSSIRTFCEAAVSNTNTSNSNNKKMYTVAQFPCLNDNYGYLLHDEETGNTAAIDTPCAKTYQQELDKRGWKLTHIFNTHHHWDHTGGNVELKAAAVAAAGGTDVIKVYGPAIEKDKIPEIDFALSEGDTVQFGTNEGTIIEVGGHTHGHIAYHFGATAQAFTGDALFSLGCGRMFEGNPTLFWGSLQKLRNLPDNTTIYCGHEYTAANAKFALSVEPGNAHLQARAKQVEEQRAKGEPTVPTLLGEEKKANPFLRVDISEEIRKNVGVEAGDSDAEAFRKVRQAKDSFRG
jgi:hydroxyacylglutathione hydrolase